MQAGNSNLANRSNPGGTILIVAIAIMGLMVLFPPKAVVKSNPMLNISETTSSGFTFIFADPAGQEKSEMRAVLGDDVDKLISSHIQWGKLLLQLVVVGGIGFGASKFMGKQS